MPQAAVAVDDGVRVNACPAKLSFAFGLSIGSNRFLKFKPEILTNIRRIPSHEYWMEVLHRLFRQFVKKIFDIPFSSSLHFLVYDLFWLTFEYDNMLLVDSRKTLRQTNEIHCIFSISLNLCINHWVVLLNDQSHVMLKEKDQSSHRRYFTAWISFTVLPETGMSNKDNVVEQHQR